MKGQAVLLDHQGRPILSTPSIEAIQSALSAAERGMATTAEMKMLASIDWSSKDLRDRLPS